MQVLRKWSGNWLLRRSTSSDQSSHLTEGSTSKRIWQEEDPQVEATMSYTGTYSDGWKSAVCTTGDLIAGVAVTTDSVERHLKYVKLQNLSTGSSGFVQLARDVDTDEYVAIKFLDRGLQVKDVMLRELINLSKCGQHPSIVQVKEILLMPHHLGIVMEYVEGGDLATYMHQNRQRGGGLPELEALCMFQQIVVAVDFCHRLGIALRDIKLDNVLVSRLSGGWPVVKLCDFGYSKVDTSGSGCKTACGTPEYIAPEVLTSPRYKGLAADVWSLGVMLYVLIEGTFPFRRRRQPYHIQKMIGRIINADYKIPNHGSPEVIDLLQKMLVANPAERITVPQMLEHPWVRQGLPPACLPLNDHLLQVSASRSGRFILPKVVQAVETYCHGEPSTEPSPVVELLIKQIEDLNLPAHTAVTAQQKGFYS